jgi:apolipoprotein N-acyltransferase
MSKARAFPARCGLAILSGLACALAFPPFGWWPLILPGLAGLLVSIHGQHSTRARILGFLYGYTALAVGPSWVWNIFGPLSIVLWADESFLTPTLILWNAMVCQ